MRSISHSTVLILTLLYVAYVVSDYTSTQWLIANDPEGIANEVNPLAKFLYTYYGLTGMLVAKSLVYMTIALTTVFIETRYKKYKMLKILKELTLLALIGYSLAIVVNNSMTIFALSVTKDPAIATWMVKTYGIVLSITLTSLISLYRFSRSYRDAIELTLAVAFLFLPVWILDKFYPLVFHSYWNTALFSAGLLTVITLVILLQNKFRVTRSYLSYG